MHHVRVSWWVVSVFMWAMVSVWESESVCGLLCECGSVSMGRCECGCVDE